MYKGNTTVEMTRPQRSTFDMSQERRLTTRMGRLTPVFVAETIPNDSWYGRSEIFIRLAPLLAPIYARVNVFMHWFFIPNRILGSWWEPFITGGRLGAEVVTPPVPSRFTFLNVAARAQQFMSKSKTINYMGMPPWTDADLTTTFSSDRTFDVLPLAAFYKCWYDWYRDRNYVADNTILPLPAGTIATTATIDALMATRLRAWEHDYFTSAQTNTQRGTQVLMPLAGAGTVTYLPVSLVQTQAGAGANANTLIGTDGSPQSMTVNKPTAAGAGTPGRIENIQSVNITSSSVSINDFRTAYALQVWLERNQLAGSRMNESIMAHFGRRTSDSRLQRAEYLGGSKVPIQISDIEATAWSNDGTDDIPQGNLAGKGVSYGNSNSFSYNCEEWGFIMGIMSVLPRTSYKAGMPRMFQSRDTFLDYPWPTFAHLGEQKVLNWELLMTNTSVTGTRSAAPLFGYQSRYSDWKQMYSFDSGDFYDNMAFWTLTRKFTSQPVLGETFVTFDDTLQDQIFAVAAVDTLWCYIYNDIKVKRALPYYGTPQLAR